MEGLNSWADAGVNGRAVGVKGRAVAVKGRGGDADGLKGAAEAVSPAPRLSSWFPFGDPVRGSACPLARGCGLCIESCMVEV